MKLGSNISNLHVKPNLAKVANAMFHMNNSAIMHVILIREHRIVHDVVEQSYYVLRIVNTSVIKRGLVMLARFML